MIKRFASVDIGSNTIKVTITDYLGKDRFKKVLYQDFPSCLGSNMSKEKVINVLKLGDCVRALNEIKEIINKKKVDEHKYIATHALREANNQEEILSLIKADTDIDVNVISGEQEAGLTLKAILMDFPASKNYACINAGGGSTELSFYLPGKSEKEQFYFFRFGAVNLYSDYIKGNSNIDSAIKKIGEMIDIEFRKLNISIPIIDQVVSVGGSIYNAAYIFKKDDKRNFDELFNMRMDMPGLESVIHRLTFSSEEQKKEIRELDEQRINTTLPGILIHYFLLKCLKKNDLVISTRSISDGLIYEMATGDEDDEH